MAVGGRLEIEGMTPHWQPVSGAGVRIQGRGSESTAAERAPGSYEAHLPGTGDYSLVIEPRRAPDGFDHRPLQIELSCTRGEGASLHVAAALPGEGTAQLQSIREDEQGIHRISVILDYLWFTPIGYPPTSGN